MDIVHRPMLPLDPNNQANQDAPDWMFAPVPMPPPRPPQKTLDQHIQEYKDSQEMNQVHPAIRGLLGVRG
jgi:hypothetical protein